MNDTTDDAAPPRRYRNALVRIIRSRDFSRDLFVTTLGVLIALAIGAFVEEIRWRLRLGAAERMMDEELSWVRGAYAYHLLSQNCINNRAEALFELIDDARKTKRLPDIRGIGFSRDFGSYGDSWNLAQSSDVLLHMSPRTAVDYSSIWVNVRYWGDSSTRARLAWQSMAEIAHRPGPVSHDLLDDASRQLMTAVRASETVAGMSIQDDEKFRKRGIPRLTADGEPFNLKKLRAEVDAQNMCQPLMVDGKPYQLTETPPPTTALPKDLRG